MFAIIAVQISGLTAGRSGERWPVRAEFLIGWDWVPEGPTQPQETQPYESMQHFLAGVETVFARGIRKGGEGTQGRAARARFHQLGSVHGDVVLPVGPGAFVARDLWWTGVLRGAVEAFGGAGGTQGVHAGLRQ